MKITVFSAMVIIGMFFIAGCQKESGTLLKLDYTAKADWKYTIAYKAEGIFTQNEAVTTKNTTINTAMNGTAAGGRFIIKVGNVDVVSDMINDTARQQLADQFTKAEYSLLITDGYPAIDSAAALPAGSFHEWDLYRQLAKLLPSLPTQRVMPGFTWERTDNLPLKTDVGTVPCEVYRNYGFDSLSTDGAMAYISWEFRYSADQKFIDTVDIVKQIPVAGNGRGSAQLDLVKKCVVRAEMGFKAPVATVGDIKVDWQEQAVLTLQ